jgi:hypothetical protein
MHLHRIGLCLALVLSSCSARSTLPQDAYVWQRAWKPALSTSMRQAAPLIRDWRILAAEADENGQLRVNRIDWPTVNASGKPVIMVIRIDGQLPVLEQPALRKQIVALWNEWRTRTRLIGIEIDHDCASARLDTYARFLARLRQETGQETRLYMTALPSWLGSRSLDALLAEVDEAVLQVHAVENPQSGLFNQDQALRWIMAFSLHHKPFRVALPTYGSRIGFARNGRVVSVTSEVPAEDQADDEAEWIVPPQQVAALLATLNARPVDNLQGIAWFRLPTADDQRSWGLATWMSIINGQPLHPRLTLRLEPQEQAQLFDLVLSNTGSSDAELPIDITVPCPLGDAVAGYTATPEFNRYRFTRIQPGLLHPGQHKLIGWLRCPGGVPHG